VHSKSKSKRDPLKVYKRSATSLKVNAFFRARRLRLRDVYNRMGLSLIRRIREENLKISILVLSAKPEDVMAGYTRTAGANGYVGKGRQMSELITALKTILFGYDCFPADPAGPAPENALSSLSVREVEVLQHLARGASNRDIASRLFLSDKTVSTYKSRIQEKLGLSSLAALIEFASLHKLID
ncbi:MAG TPA: response regulator transcription factor, partial [Paraburkholderia sp.]|uniref:response regulator transcription factor n=1 Tax=Paraburkholderia sp. TaxID=1926495 RepID=UPI002ED1FB71